MARVLVVELGERRHAASLLASEGFAVVTSGEGTEALLATRTTTPDVIVIESTLLAHGVARLCGALRGATNAPIATLSASGSEREVVDVYTAGADAHIADSVGPHELVARLRALLRRFPQQMTAANPVLRVGPVVLDGASRELFVDGQLVAVPRREFEIAELLMRRVGVVVTRAELIRELWGTHRDTKSLDVQVGRLRARIATVDGRRLIITIRGVGYRFLTEAEMPEKPDAARTADVIDLRPPDIDLLIEEQAAGAGTGATLELGRTQPR